MTSLNHAVGKHQRVDESGTSHIDVKTSAAEADALLNDTAQPWGDMPVGHVRDQEEIYLVGSQA